MVKAKQPDPTRRRPPRVLVYGRPGSGKTWGLTGFPKAYYIDTEGGACNPAYQARLAEAGSAYWGPDDGANDPIQILGEVLELGQGNHGYRLLVIDSVSKVYDRICTEDEPKTGSNFGRHRKRATAWVRQLIAALEGFPIPAFLVHHALREFGDGEAVTWTHDGYEKAGHELSLELEIFTAGARHLARVRKSWEAETFPPGLTFDFDFTNFANQYRKDRT